MHKKFTMNEIRKPQVLLKSSRRIRLSLPRLVYANSQDHLLDGRLLPVPRILKAPPEVEPESIS